MSISTIKKSFQDSILVKNNILKNNLLDVILDMGDEIVEAILNNKKLMICGNGGSAADAQHLAAELLVRLKPKNNREGIPAIALSQDISTITACGNDFGFDRLYERMVEALGNSGDVLLAITTSGNSENIRLALLEAKKRNIKTFAFLGTSGGSALELCDRYFLVPSNDTARIQESHITAGHALMEHIEDKLIEHNYLKIK
jgi:D-sedoheptulose 7-phosphate isomerase